MEAEEEGRRGGAIVGVLTIIDEEDAAVCDALGANLAPRHVLASAYGKRLRRASEPGPWQYSSRERGSGAP
jgi:hypothetical protein